MSGPFQNKFFLVLRIPSKLTVDTICKGLVIFEACSEKTLELRLSDWSLFHEVIFMLMQLLGDHTM